MYDDFDYEIKNRATILSNALFDYFLINIKRFTKISYTVKTMMKEISEYKNNSNRILILKWIYMIDSFPSTSLTYVLDLII